jgi:outer membrane protein TolC
VAASRTFRAQARSDPSSRAVGQRSADPEEISLGRAVEIALAANPMTRATASGRALAAAQLDEARASRLPLLQFTENFARGNNPVFVFGSLLEQGRFGPGNFQVHSLNNPESISNFRTALTLRFPLFDQRQSATRIAQARIGEQQSDEQQKQAAQQIRFEVIKAYYGLLVAQAKKAEADDAVKMEEADVTRIRARFDAGLVVQSDLMAAQVQLAEFEQQRIEADSEVVTAGAALNLALGLPLETRHIISGDLVERQFHLQSQERLVAEALVKRSDCIRAGLAVRSGEQGERLAHSELLPRVDTFATYGVSGQGLASGSADYVIGATLTFNIFDPGRAARREEAQAAKAIASAEQDRVAARVRFEVISAYQHYTSARERSTVALQAIAQASEALRIVNDRYDEGLAVITEVLRAETAKVRARVNLLEVRYDYYVGYAAVLLAAGDLTGVESFVS